MAEEQERAEKALEVLRILLGGIWAANLTFIVLPAADYWSTFGAVAASYGPLSFGGAGFAAFVAAHPLYFAWLIAGMTVYLAIALLLGFTTRLACGLGFVASLAFFLTQWGQTFVAPGGSDVGAHPLYMLIYAVLILGGAGRSWSVDARLAASPRWARLFRWIGTWTQRPPSDVRV